MTAAQLQLLTAAVDGELTAPERRALRTLLASSDEAQETFAKLQADRARLRALPPVAPPADLHARILAKLAAAVPVQPRKARPLAGPAHRAATARRMTWVPAAVAAGVLLCVTLGSFAFFRATNPQHQIVKGSWSKVLPATEEAPASVPSPVPGRFDRPDPVGAVRVDVSPVPPVPTPRQVPPAAVALAPAPRPINPDLIGSPLRLSLPPFERVEVKVPFLRPVADLGREDVADELLDAIGRDAGPAPVRFDLFVRDTARGVEVFQNAARASGLSVHADAATVEKLKRKQVQAAVVYTEALAPKELADLFAKLAAEDAKYSPRVGDALHVTAIARADELELKAVMGFDVGLYKRPASAPPGGAGPDRVSPGKSVNADTIDRVVQSVSGAKPTDKPAVLLTWQTTSANTPRTNPTTSAELKQYLQKRGERKPNAVPVIVVIRTAG